MSEIITSDVILMKSWGNPNCQKIYSRNIAIQSLPTLRQRLVSAISQPAIGVHPNPQRANCASSTALSSMSISAEGLPDNLRTICGGKHSGANLIADARSARGRQMNLASRALGVTLGDRAEAPAHELCSPGRKKNDRRLTA